MAEFMRKIHSTKQDTVVSMRVRAERSQAANETSTGHYCERTAWCLCPSPGPRCQQTHNNLGIEFRSPRQLWFSTSQSHGTINTFLLSHLLLIVPSAHPVLPGLRLLRRYPSQITWTSMSPPAPNRPTAPQHHWAASQFVYFYYALKVCTWLVMIVK